MSIPLSISTGAAVPIYRQITDQIRLGVASGRLTAGEQLPSVRALAESLVVNVNTVARAYGDLLREGIVESQPGRGVFIAERRRVYTRQEAARRLEGPLRALVSEAVALGFTATEVRDAVDKALSGWSSETSARKPTKGDRE